MLQKMSQLGRGWFEYFDKNVKSKWKKKVQCSSFPTIILDPRSQRAGSYKIGAVIVNV